MSILDPLPGLRLVSEPTGQDDTRQCHTRLPAHYAVIGPDASPDETAAYYMYHHKIILCPKTHSHDWGACPYAHEKENARRRDPSTHIYSSCICPNARKPEGCPNGVACPYAHTLFEYWLHPQRYRTQMCHSGSNCQRRLCFFAHSAAELRVTGSTHELHIPMPPLVTAAASAGTNSALTGPPGQPVSEAILSAPPAAPAGGAHWLVAVEGSSKSFSSQASRVLAGLAPGVSSCSGSETNLAVSNTSNDPAAFVPGHPARAALPATAVLVQQQQQQELQHKQALCIELQLQLHQRQQQHNMRAALLQMELVQQQQQLSTVLAATSHPMLPDVNSTSLAGLCLGLGQGVGTSNPGSNLGVALSFMPIITEGITHLDPINLTSPALAASVDLNDTLPGHALQPVGVLTAQPVPNSCISPAANMTPLLAGLANLGLSNLNIVSPSGAVSFGGGADVVIRNESLLSAHGGGLVQAWI